MGSWPHRVGGELLHPLALIAVCVLALNDHVLKAAIPSPLTGKLSDFAGLVLAPLLLATVAGRFLPAVSTERIRWCSAGLVVLGFAVVKLTDGGAAAFGWSLGLAQWLFGGWLAGGAAQPATIVADPTDLFALPGVAIALWIARRSPSRTAKDDPGPTRRREALAVAATALVLLATSQSAPSVSSVWSEPIRLSEETPFVARYVTFSVDQGTDEGRLTYLDVSASDSSDDAVLEMTTFLDDRAGTVPLDGYNPLVSSVDLTERCRVRCESGVTVIIRRLAGAGHDVDVTLSATIRVESGTDDAALKDVRLTIDDDPARAFEGVPERLAISASGLVRATIDDRVEAGGTVLRIDCDALGPIGYPLIGRLTVDANVEQSGEHSWSSSWQVSVADDTRRPGSDDPPVDLDIARFCGANRDGDVPIEFFIEYAPITAGVRPQPSSVSAFVEYRWTADLEILAFDGRDLLASVARFMDR